VTAENAGFFISGLAAGLTFLGDMVVIAFISAGYIRWSVYTGAAVLSLLNAVGTAFLVAHGADPLNAALAMLKTGGMAAAAVLLPAVLATWVCWKFWIYVGGLNAK
jgi:hypothetical protein